MKVCINRGAPDAWTKLAEWPREDWHLVMSVRREFIATKLPFDCRMLLEYVQEAETLYADLGFASLEECIRDGYELDPELVSWAVTGLRALRPDEPLPFPAAVKVGKLLAHGRPRKGEEKGAHSTLKRGSTNAAYLRARLARDFPEVLAALERGEHKSVRAAAITVGVVKVPSALALLQRVWGKATEAERAEFAAWAGLR